MRQNHQQLYKRVIFSIIVLISIYIIGIIGYMLIEKMPLLDAIFMTTITITTVGYGIKNLSTGGTIFTIILITIGAGTVAYILISLTDFLLSEFLSGRVQDRRIKKMISKLK